MATITLKNIPPKVHKELKAMARAHGRSLNREIIHVLERSLEEPIYDAGSVKKQARRLRESMGVYLTRDKLTEMKNDGRS